MGSLVLLPIIEIHHSLVSPNVNHELFVEAPVVEVVAKGPYEHGQTLGQTIISSPRGGAHLQRVEDPRGVLEHAVDAVGHVEAWVR